MVFDMYNITFCMDMYNITFCMCSWREVRNFLSQKFR